MPKSSDTSPIGGEVARCIPAQDNVFSAEAAAKLSPFSTACTHVFRAKSLGIRVGWFSDASKRLSEAGGGYPFTSHPLRVRVRAGGGVWGVRAGDVGAVPLPGMEALLANCAATSLLSEVSLDSGLSSLSRARRCMCLGALPGGAVVGRS